MTTLTNATTVGGERMSNFNEQATRLLRFTQAYDDDDDALSQTSYLRLGRMFTDQWRGTADDYPGMAWVSDQTVYSPRSKLMPMLNVCAWRLLSLRPQDTTIDMGECPFCKTKTWITGAISKKAISQRRELCELLVGERNFVPVPTRHSVRAANMALSKDEHYRRTPPVILGGIARWDRWGIEQRWRPDGTVPKLYRLACCSGTGRTCSTYSDLFFEWSEYRELIVARGHTQEDAERFARDAVSEEGALVFIDMVTHTLPSFPRSDFEFRRLERPDVQDSFECEVSWVKPGRRNDQVAFGLSKMADELEASEGELGVLLSLVLAQDPLMEEEAKELAIKLLRKTCQAFIG